YSSAVSEKNINDGIDPGNNIHPDEKKMITREVFNLGSENSISRNDMDSKVRSALGSRYKINPDDLVLSSSYNDTKKGPLSILKYTQTYNGLPVYSSSVIVGVKDEKIVTLKSTHRPKIDISTKPVLSESDATGIVENDMGVPLETKVVLQKPIHINNQNIQKSANKNNAAKEIKTNVEGISLLVFPRYTGEVVEYRLAYKVEPGLIENPPAKWVYIVDANNGEILEKYNKIVSSTLSGRVTVPMYPENPNQTMVVKGSRAENLYNYGSASSNVFWSGKDNYLDNQLYLKNPINLAGVSSATLQFRTNYSMETNYDKGFVYISTDGTNYSWIKSFTGNSSTWKTINLDLSDYIGHPVWIAFQYTTDSYITYDGWYLDEIKVITNNGVVFQDNADNFVSWNNYGFSMIQQIVPIYTTIGTTGADGNYSISGLPGSFILSSALEGPNVRVFNYSGNDADHQVSITTPSVHNWNWNDYDTSYKKEQSNVFYHVNAMHDFFTKGYPFDIYAMNYQTTAYVQYPGTCNAFSDGKDLYFYGAGSGCEATSLFGDIINHEYTHGVVDHIYTTRLPNRDESGALNEGWADYFTSSVNNNSCVGEGFLGVCLRDIHNTYKYPDDIVGEVHYDSNIVSGAAWDLREMLGNRTTDELIINAIKLEPFNFTEYLEDVLVADDNNANLGDGTPHILEICTAFYANHGIYSNYCNMFPAPSENLGVLANPGFEGGNTGWTQYGSNGYSRINNNSEISRSGSRYAFLGGYDNANDYIYQDVTIPSNAANAYVQFWYWIQTNEVSTDIAYDNMRLEIRNPADNTLLKTFANLSNLNSSSDGYRYRISRQYDVSEFKGQTVRLRLSAATDSGDSTVFRVDDFALKSPVAAADNGTLAVSAIPGTVTAGTPTNIVFTVTPALGGVLITLSGSGVSKSGTTTNGLVTITGVNATSKGAINVTASLTGYTSGTTTVIVTEPGTLPSQVADWDTDKSGTISKTEAVAAVRAYLTGGGISKAIAIAVVRAYLIA
ncbi:MAG: hypothetical protein WA144_12545, partial [Candidatus Methanoperedens sp.]